MSSKQTEIQQAFQQQMDEKELLNCMRCGFCLPSCPTYIESGQQETHSPRGRIALMKAVRDGVIEPDEDVEHSLNLCLGCVHVNRSALPALNMDSYLKMQETSFSSTKNNPFLSNL